MRMGPIAMADMVGLDLGIQAVQKAGSFKPDKVGAARLFLNTHNKPIKTS